LEAADLVEAVRAVVELVDCLAVVFESKVEVAKLAVDLGANFEGGGEGIDAIEVRAECLLAFFDGCSGGVEGLLLVS
jgi:hypothetical protein